MSDALGLRVTEWPLPADEMGLAIVLARLACESTRTTPRIALSDLSDVLGLHPVRLCLLLRRLEKRGAINRVSKGEDAVFIVAPCMRRGSR